MSRMSTYSHLSRYEEALSDAEISNEVFYQAGTEAASGEKLQQSRRGLIPARSLPGNGAPRWTGRRHY